MSRMATKGSRLISPKGGHNLRNIINSQDHEFPFTQAGLEAAIADLPAFVYPYGGGKIWLPNGTMDVNSTIFIDRPLWLQGIGRMGRTELRLVDGANCRLLQLQADADWCKICDIWFEGNGAAQVAGDYLLYLAPGTYTEMESCYVMRAYETGVYIDSQDTRLEGVFSEFNGVNGLHIIMHQNFLMDWCTAWSNGDVGILLSNAEPRGLITHTRICENEGTAGLYLMGCHETDIVHSWISLNDGHGIDIYASPGIRVLDCIIRDNSQAVNNTKDGIHIRDASENLEIIGNKIYSALANKQRWGINEVAPADENRFLNNKLYGNVTGQINKTGVNSLMEENKGNDDATGVVPTAPWTGMVYLDDGTNTVSTNPGYRYWDGLAWNDL